MIFLHCTIPGALPQVRHGESVLWRTTDESAPLALRNAWRAAPGFGMNAAPLAQQNSGTLPGFEMNAALLGAKRMPCPWAAASSAWWIRATLSPVACAVLSAFDFGTDDESPLRTADTTASRRKSAEDSDESRAGSGHYSECWIKRKERRSLVRRPNELGGLKDAPPC